MSAFELKPFHFDEIDELCISARMRIETDPRINKIREVAQRLISHSEIPFASVQEAYTGLSRQAVKLLEREGFNAGDKYDVALVIALLATEYRHLPTVDKGLSYEDVFKDCYSSYMDIADGPASRETIERLKSEVDTTVSEQAMYNAYLFMESYLNAAFSVMSHVHDNRDYCARELAGFLDTKRDREAPRGDIWCSMVARILLKSTSLKNAIEHDPHLDAKNDLHIYDTCHNFKHVDYTDEFFLELYESFKKNETIYHIHEAIPSPESHFSDNGKEILVYDRCRHLIKLDFFNKYEMGSVPIYCIGTVNDYVCSFLNVDISRFSDNLGKLYQYADLYDADEKQISAQACDKIDKAVQTVYGIKQDDCVFQKAHVFFVSQWLEYKVNLNHCSRQQLIEGISALCKLKEAECEDLPKYEQEEFENSLDEYFYNYAIMYGYNFYLYLKFSLPILGQYESKKTFPRRAYAKCLVEYFIYQAQATNIEENVQKQIIDILSEKRPFDYYTDRISRLI